MNAQNDALSEKLMHLRVMMRRQYVTNHGKGFGMLLYGIHKKSAGNTMTITEVSQEFSVSVAAATQMVKMLKREGLVDIAKDNTDGRVTRVKVNAAGEVVIRQVETAMSNFLNGLTDHLGADDTAHLDSILGKILTYLATNDINPQGEKNV
ncbi:MAG TPA: hypothetical protein DCR44_00390 [Acholeplasmatales bacterium]|nr:MAG: hypothetical protein A2Y16_06010 [Tenericutes bacterium GWF2_57_13]HAQ55860.1 hypothetical protein [Acholeplasmatales bacterium]